MYSIDSGLDFCVRKSLFESLRYSCCGTSFFLAFPIESCFSPFAAPWMMRGRPCDNRSWTDRWVLLWFIFSTVDRRLCSKEMRSVEKNEQTKKQAEVEQWERNHSLRNHITETYSQDGLKKMPLIRFHMPSLPLYYILCCYFSRLAPDSFENLCQDCYWTSFKAIFTLLVCCYPFYRNWIS